MHNSKGYILAVTILFILLFVFFGLSSIYIAGLQNQATEKKVANIRAFWLAEAGIEKAVWNMNENGGTWSADWTPTVTEKGAILGYMTTNPLVFYGDGSGNCEVEISAVATSMPNIRSYGYIRYAPFGLGETPSKNDPLNYGRRSIEVGLYKNTFDYGLMGKNHITLVGSVVAYPKTDSYDSSLGTYGQTLVDGSTNAGEEGDIATNGYININGNQSLIYVNGDAYYGGNDADNDFSEVQISGSEDRLEEPLYFATVSVPPVFAGMLIEPAPSGTIVSGPHVYSSIILQSDVLTIQSPAQIYLTDSVALSLTSTAQIAIVGDEPVEIYANGDVKLAGQGITNESGYAGNFQIYGLGTHLFDLSFSGTSGFCGVIYAPDSDIKIAGTAFNMYGALVGNTIEIKGTGSIHYDTQLSNLQYGDDLYSVTRWQDKFEELL